MRRKGVMLCYPLEVDRLEGSSRKAWNCWPVICQPKLDGIRCKAEIRGGQVILLTSEENVIYSLPYINQSLSSLPDCTLDGEIYSYTLPFEELCSAVLRDTPYPNPSIKVSYQVFDLVSDQLQHIRLDRLSSLITPNLLYTACVEKNLAHSVDEIYDLINEYISRDFEGIIVRHPLNQYVPKRSTHILKFKPKKSDCYRIVGIKQEIGKDGNPKESVGSFVCFKDDQLFSVGSGLTQEQRKFYWNSPPLGKWVRINYQALTEKGVPRFPVFVEVIDEPDKD